MKYVDLHVHSTASDGTFSPSDLVDHAVSLGLSAFALTDHDTTHGVAEAKERAAWHKAHGHSIEIYTGVEISAGYKNKDIHIVGLFINENDETLNRALEASRNNRDQRNDRMIERFAEHGIALSMEELVAADPASVITRP